MSSGPADPLPEPGDSEPVVVASGQQAPRQRTFHAPADGDGLAAACGRLQLDGQRLPRSLAEQQRLDPCRDCFEET